MGVEERLATIYARAAVKRKHHWYFKWWGILIILILLSLAIFITGSGIYVFKTATEINNNRFQTQLLEKSQANRTLIEGTHGYWIGTSTPKITITEFGDFACPYCKDSYPTVREIGLLYKDSVKIIFRDFLGHENALDLALAARCAGEQNKFWPMHDKLFINQDTLQLGDLSGLAQQIGLDVPRFNTCLSTKKYAAHIQEDLDDAAKLEVTGTPTWFINDYKIVGEIPRDKFIQLIEEMLKQ
jgi:predicted DsbA family dithiol-disulfide isomerase